MTALYKVTVLIPNAPLMIERHYNLTSSLEAKAVLAYAEGAGLSCSLIYSRHDNVVTACADIERELRLAARREYA